MLLQQYQNLYRLPLFGLKFANVRLMASNPVPDLFFYLKLVDVADNAENTLNIDTGLCADQPRKEEHPCPKTITHNVVKVLRKRIETIPDKPDPITQEIVRELKSVNERFAKKLHGLEAKIDQMMRLLDQKAIPE